MFMEEIIDMSYFCRCLGEGFKEESLKYTGFASRDDEDSFVETNIAASQEERTQYSI